MGHLLNSLKVFFFVFGETFVLRQEKRRISNQYQTCERRGWSSGSSVSRSCVIWVSVFSWAFRVILLLEGGLRRSPSALAEARGSPARAIHTTSMDRLRSMAKWSHRLHRLNFFLANFIDSEKLQISNQHSKTQRRIRRAPHEAGGDHQPCRYTTYFSSWTGSLMIFCPIPAQL